MFLVLDQSRFFGIRTIQSQALSLKSIATDYARRRAFQKRQRGDSAKRTKHEPYKVMILKKLTIRY